MRFEILLEPPGDQAGKIMRDWLAAFSLTPGADNLIEAGPDDSFELLAELRKRCYERGMTVNVKFYGKDD
ncbi:MAG: hypothetical protein LC633_05965 [Desulfobulbaceae bacterium]|nr:hypothetical protein [Desulfobulbaceae bacterium]